MWILESDGDVLQHKRIWLRPGKKYLFGRTRPEGGGFVIENKSISRKHLTITVADVKPGDGSHVHTRSELTIEDQNAKIGTHLDGEQIRGQSRVLSKDEHEIKLGSFPQLFRIRWEPVVLSFSFSSKEQKNKDPLIPVRARLEALDIKAIIPYVTNKTTHVVASKRNTAKGLQALINARYIVDDSFVDAIVAAATPGAVDGIESQAPLEIDFDANWPDVSQHLPAQAKEPKQRPAEFFAPDPKRANVFENFTFVFCDQTQFDNLQAPIANGGGKAVLFQLQMGKTTVEEIVQYVKNVSGEKENESFQSGDAGKGAVVVRFRGKKGMEDWAIELGNDVARRLDQRLIEQSEFLDAILVNDASVLRRPLPEEDDESIRAPPNTAMPSTQERHEAVEEEAAEKPSENPVEEQPKPTRRSRMRRAVTSRFKGFDDFDSASTPQKSLVDSSLQISSVPQDNATREESQGLFVSQSVMDVDSQPHETSATQNRSSRKRSAPPSDHEDDAEVVETMLPAAAAMKRRRIDEERRGISTKPSQSQQTPVESPKMARKPNKEINVREAAREHLEAEEEVARLGQESLQASLEGIDIEQMKNLALVEEMEVLERPNRPSRTAAYGDTGDRWDERWNGRKNFKKFRRRVEAGAPAIQRRAQKVIVPLEEVKKKDYGIGEEYWIEGRSYRTKRGKEKERENELDSLTSQHSRSESQPFATARSQPSQQPSEAHVISDDDNDDDDHDQVTNRIDDEMPEVTEIISKPSRGVKSTRRTAAADPSSQPPPSAGRAAHNTRSSDARTSSKRPAPVASSSGAAARAQQPPPKKRRQTTLARGARVQDSDDEEDESEDELKFRFRRRRG
ncbi:MAG: hypothetical protein M1819_002987 [Sarea resinae]|nr:MAG: hypothetical protein M1819_002987 [Sarea resinae]